MTDEAAPFLTIPKDIDLTPAAPAESPVAPEIGGESIGAAAAEEAAEEGKVMAFLGGKSPSRTSRASMRCSKETMPKFLAFASRRKELGVGDWIISRGTTT